MMTITGTERAQPFFGAENAGIFASAPSASFTSKDFNGLARTQRRTQTGDADGNGEDNIPIVRPTVRANPLKNKAADGADDADAKIPAESGPEQTGLPGWRARL
jgi:hypothetical protein